MQSGQEFLQDLLLVNDLGDPVTSLQFLDDHAVLFRVLQLDSKRGGHHIRFDILVILFRAGQLLETFESLFLRLKIHIVDVLAEPLGLQLFVNRRDLCLAGLLTVAVGRHIVLGAHRHGNLDFAVPGVAQVANLHLCQHRRPHEQQGDTSHDHHRDRHRQIASQTLAYLG